METVPILKENNKSYLTCPKDGLGTAKQQIQISILLLFVMN